MLSSPCLYVSFLELLLISVSCPIRITFKKELKKLSIGPLYYIYMSLLSTFATNSINILAGINGSEVGQALIIALSVILNDLMYLPWPIDFRIPLHLLGNKAELDFGGVWNAGMAFGSRQLVERHLFSLYFMLPLVAVCTGFMYHNWYVNTQLNSRFYIFCVLSIVLLKVSCTSVSGGHFMLCYGNGLCCCWNSSSFLEDAVAVLCASNLQFPSVLSTIIWARSMSTA